MLILLSMLNLCSADQLLAIAAAHTTLAGASTTALLASEGHWQTILSKTSEVVSCVQQWSPRYYSRMNPMNAYIIFLTITVLIYGSHSATVVTSPRSVFLADIDLLANFLRRVGQYWPVGRRLAGKQRADSSVTILIHSRYGGRNTGELSRQTGHARWHRRALVAHLGSRKVASSVSNSDISIANRESTTLF
jgi:hypothetical protein